MNNPSILTLLVTNSKVWAAFYIVVRSVVHYLVPTFPQEVAITVDGFVAVILSALTYQDVKATRSLRGGKK